MNQSKNSPKNRTVASQVLLTLAAFIVVVAGMKASSDLLVPFLLAIFIATISAAPLFWLQKKGVPRWLSMVVIVLGILLVSSLMLWLFGSSVRSFSNNLPKYEKEINRFTALTINHLSDFGINISGSEITQLLNPGSAMKFVASGLNSLRKLLTNGFMITLTVIFMLLEASSIPNKLRFIMGRKQKSMAPFDDFISTVKNYIAIKTAFSLITGVLAGILTFSLGLDFAVLWGLVAFALNFVPSIGSIIAAIPPVLLAVVQLGPIKALIIILGYLIINITIGSIIEPRFMGRGLGLSTLVVFLSLVFWGWVLGPIGMLLSVPLTITVKIALDIGEETKWLSVLLGPEKVSGK